MINRETLEEMMKKRQAEAWKASCPSNEELLCLQLLGYSSRQLYENIENNCSLKTVAAKYIHELDKAKCILDRQAKSGVITIPYISCSFQANSLDSSFHAASSNTLAIKSLFQFFVAILLVIKWFNINSDAK